LRLPREPRIFLLVLALSACRIDADFTGTAFSCPDERCPTGFVCADGRCVDPETAADAATVDGAPGDADSPDASCACTPGVFADSCQSGDVVELDGARSPGGQTICASTAANSNALLGCVGAPLPGQDAVFRIGLAPGEALSAELRREGFDGALYVVIDCSSGQCLEHADQAGVGGTETLTVVAAQGVDHYVVVDSGSGAGCYRLTVTVE
jgi:hypothetical protein